MGSYLFLLVIINFFDSPLLRISRCKRGSYAVGIIPLQTREYASRVNILFICCLIAMLLQPFIDFGFVEYGPPVHPISERGLVSFDPPFR